MFIQMPKRACYYAFSHFTACAIIVTTCFILFRSSYFKFVFGSWYAVVTDTLIRTVEHLRLANRQIKPKLASMQSSFSCLSTSCGYFLWICVLNVLLLTAECHEDEKEWTKDFAVELNSDAIEAQLVANTHGFEVIREVSSTWFLTLSTVQNEACVNNLTLRRDSLCPFSTTGSLYLNEICLELCRYHCQFICICMSCNVCLLLLNKVSVFHVCSGLDAEPLNFCIKIK